MLKYLIAIILALTTIVPAGAREWRLERGVTPVRVEAAEWDMSGGEALPRDMAVIYKAYGDSLVCESADGRRRWFRVDGDSATYILEESRLATVRPTAPLPTAALGDTRHVGDCDFEARGSYSRTFKLAEQGRYETREVGRGRLVVAPGDTLPGVRAISECRSFTAKISADDITLPLDAVADSLERYEIVTTRWFADGTSLPVAVQTEVTVSDAAGHCRDGYNRTRVIDAAEYAAVRARVSESRDDVSRRLAEAKVSVTDGMMTIAADISGWLTVDVSTPGGVNWLRYTVDSCAGAPIELDVTTLPHGRYIVTLATDLPASAKHMVAVR